MTLNSAQRKGLALVGVGVLFAGLAFLIASNYTQSVSSEVGEKVTVYRVSRAVPPFTKLRASHVETISVPKRWVPAGAFSTKGFLGRSTSVAMQDGEYVSESMLVPEQELNSGEREIAILVDAETGVGGRIKQGDLVNVNATFQENSESGRRISAVMIRDAKVLSIGGQKSRRDESGGEQTLVPVTFALNEEESLRLLYAESFSTSVRLSKVPIGDNSPLPKKRQYSSNDLAKLFGAI